jgi:hypothetical protein
MSSPESSRNNLEHARRLGRVKFWRTRRESQRIKAEIVVMHRNKAELSQRVIARTFHVSQPYVAKLLRRVRVLGIEKALGEAYEQYRERMEAKRREHFLAVGGPSSLTAERMSCPIPAWACEVPQQAEPISSMAPAPVKVDDTQYVELAQSTTGEVIEIYDSKPVRTAPVYTPPSRTLTTREIAAMGPGLSVADQCPSFGRR